jgi:type IV fimbrial biogenesis protein FimT
MTKGFTLIELMVTVAIAVILIGIAAPSFNSYIRNQGVKSAAIDLNLALTLARSEAIKRNNDVVIAAATGGWQNGWSISSTLSGTTTTLATQSAYTGITITGPAASVTYGADGRIKGLSSPQFQITGPNSSRCITVSLSGLPNNASGSC